MKTRVCLLLPEPKKLDADAENAAILRAFRAICENACGNGSAQNFCVIGSREHISQLVKNVPANINFTGTEFIALNTRGFSFWLLTRLRCLLKNVVCEYESQVLQALEPRKFELLLHCSPITKKFKTNHCFRRSTKF